MKSMIYSNVGSPVRGNCVPTLRTMSHASAR